MPLRIAFSVGEPSGDEHAARIIASLQATDSSIVFKGMGGRNMRARGAELAVDCEARASLMGFQEVLLNARKIWETWKDMRRLLVEWKPHALVLVDYADFNLRLAKEAHKLGIKVLYYITPQLWAWRSGRAELFKRYVDRAAVIFPFERNFFEAREYTKATFVGHPFTDTLYRSSDPVIEAAHRESFLTSVGLDPTRKVFAIFPGSRPSEIQRLFQILWKGAEFFQAEHPEVQIVFGVAPAVAGLIKKAAPTKAHHFHFVEGKSLDLLRTADAALLKSGTSNLQAAFFGTPFSMIFVAPWLSEVLVKSLVKIKQYSIVNVIRPNTVRELLQREVSAPSIKNEMERLLFDAPFRQALVQGFEEVRAALASHDSAPEFSSAHTESERTAALIYSLASSAQAAPANR